MESFLWETKQKGVAVIQVGSDEAVYEYGSGLWSEGGPETMDVAENISVYATPNFRVPLLERFLDHNQDLRRDYRLSRTTIEALMGLLRRDKTHGWGEQMEVLITIYWLAHGLSYSVVSRAFDVPRSTLAEVGHGFQQLSGSPAFSSCVGAIDGCHIRIKAPHGGMAADYLNRKLFHSILLQAICYSTGKFLDVFIGYPGSVHDTRVLRNSPVFASAIYPPPGHFIVKCTNNSHYPPTARIVIERAFGMMKTRWRGIFFRALEVSTIFVPKVVAVCTILHNLAVTNGDVLEAAEEDPLPPPDPLPPEQDNEEGGQALRPRLAAQVSAPRECPPQLQDHNYI
ncbi:hypothetical protein WMY93_014101 [Mugilogobius chulae]|uniref:DDE Tnp4 domain-containing protein n=1 Tax=Mugilogobius chulae TaxID=88201 RepID=A0AAW0P4L1_9GOBI